MSKLHSTPRKRMKAALSGEETKVVPAAPSYMGLYLADQVERQYLQQYSNQAGKGEYQLDHYQDSSFRAEAIKQAYLNSFQHMPDWIHTTVGPTREWAANTDLHLTKSGACYVDNQTGEGTSNNLPGGSVYVTDFLLSTSRPGSEQDVWEQSGDLDSIEEAKEQINFQTVEDLESMGIGDLPDLSIDLLGEDYFVYCVIDTPFSFLYDLLGFRGMMVKTHRRPELVKFLLQTILEQSIEFIKLFKRVGVNGVYVEEVFTSADLISLETYNEFVFHYNQRFLEEIRNIGLQSVLYVCGDIMPRIAQIGKLNPDAFAFEESKKGFEVDIENVVNELGDSNCIFGNLDAMRFGGEQATEKEMTEEVRRQIEIGKSAQSFVVSNGSPFPLKTDPRVIDKMIKVAHKSYSDDR
ncbi:hypothetical protein KGY79_07925 [Candidatus Bipolaricaulota bacterium]|nr:hypothetical protein [Candidatus Bipolaricaulota bacterium]